MTTSELFTETTDTEYKVYSYILLWRDEKKGNMLPDNDYLQTKLNKSRATIFRAIAGLRAKGLV